MTARLLRILASPYVTLACLVAALVLVVAGTLLQADGRLFQTQPRFFGSFLVWWSLAPDLRLPVLPGAYTVGAALLANLFARRVRDFAGGVARPALLLIQAGVALLLLGQLAADQFSHRAALRLSQGVATNYAEDLVVQELVIEDSSGPVVVVPPSVLARTGEVRHSESKLIVRVREYWPNADLSAKPVRGARRISATHGSTRNVAYVTPRVMDDAADARIAPAAVIELLTRSAPEGALSLGTWIVSPRLIGTQRFTHEGRELQIELGPRRLYKPFTMTLEDARREVYPGTDVARSLWSRVRIQHPSAGEDRTMVVAAGRPFRYRGETYYQSQIDANGRTSMLRVVRNPSWPVPYVSCVLLGLGLLLQTSAPVRALARQGAS